MERQHEIFRILLIIELMQPHLVILGIVYFSNCNSTMNYFCHYFRNRILLIVFNINTPYVLDSVRNK